MNGVKVTSINRLIVRWRSDEIQVSHWPKVGIGEIYTLTLPLDRRGRTRGAAGAERRRRRRRRHLANDRIIARVLVERHFERRADGVATAAFVLASAPRPRGLVFGFEMRSTDPMNRSASPQ
jgi:hypothetical protein|tara:strand:- start:80 stop:445 length:366 start_codon:yes stop_codon:yes gene_type:complete